MIELETMRIKSLAVTVQPKAAGRREADLLALESSGAPLPPPSLARQIRRDLTAIRQAYPAMAMINYAGRWEPGKLIVRLEARAMAQFKQGVYHDLEALNAAYGPVEMQSLAENLISLQFSQPYNPEYLAPRYAAADGVEAVLINWIGSHGAKIELTGAGYLFSLGWGNCPVGSMARHDWLFTIEGGRVRLAHEWGDPLLTGLKAANDGPTRLGGQTMLVARAGHDSIRAVNYTWDFGDGSPPVEGQAIVYHTYPAAGHYIAAVTARSYGSTATTSTRVVVE
jgi:hypothetical protein